MNYRIKNIDSIRPVLIQTVVTALLSIIYMLSWLSEQYDYINKHGPFVLGMICLWVSFTALRLDRSSLVKPLPWLYLAFAVYYGVGPLAYHYATRETVAAMDSFNYVSDPVLLETNLLNSSAITVIGLFLILTEVLFKSPANSENAVSDEIQQREKNKRAMWGFLIVGAIVKYTISFPHALGLVDWVVPGIIFHIDRLILVSISMLIIFVRRGDNEFIPILFIALFTEFATAIMTFSKTSIILVIIAIAVGLHLSHVRFRVLAVMAIGVAILYMTVLSPFVTYAREEFRTSGAETAQQGLNAMKSYYSTQEELSFISDDGRQVWWERIAYASTQAFVIQQYLSGYPGKSINQFFWAFVPRIIYPDKPSFVHEGTNLKDLLQNTSWSINAITAGVFAEAFWNGGLLMLAGVCAYIAFLITMIGKFAKKVVALNQLEYMPLLFSGIYFGMNIDGWFIPVYVGGLLELLAIYVILRIVFHFGVRRT